ncbi:MAG: hypothetical protein FJ100_04530 [Deltaproteobacteria bacterium]|nr:hypothetical protein [Deltaproteobacteria bacterium]
MKRFKGCESVHWMAAATLACAGCVAAVQEEFQRQGDTAGDHGPVLVAGQGRPQRAERVVVAATEGPSAHADGSAGAVVDDDATQYATWAIVWHTEGGRAVESAWQEAPDAIREFTSTLAGQAAGAGAELLRSLQNAAHPQVDDQLRWLPVAEGMVFAEALDGNALESAATGALRWVRRARPTRDGYFAFDAWHAVSRRVDPNLVPGELRDLLDHPVVPAVGAPKDCAATVRGLRVLAWLHPYSDQDPSADQTQPQRWADYVWSHGERRVVLDLATGPSCKVRTVAAWRSARLAAARTFAPVTLSENLQRKWLARLLPSLRGLPSWRDQQSAYSAYAAQCATPTVAGRTPCRPADLAPEWFAFAAQSTADGLGELGDRLNLTVLRDGGDLWIRIELRTETEPCGGDLEYFGWHQSLWHAVGEVGKPAKARLIRGLDGQDGGTADIDGDRVPDVLPQVHPPQEEVCPC